MRSRAFLLLPFIGMACGGSERRDPDGADAIEFSIAQPPVLSVGLSEGDEAYQLFRVRSAFLLESGGLVVANEGTSDLRYYDAHGQHIRTVGRKGRGPGEFESLWYARAMRGDTVVTWDPDQRRVSFFDEDGDLVDEVTIDLSSHFVEVGGLSTPASPAEMVARRDGLLFFQPGAPTWLLTGYMSDGMYRPRETPAEGVFRVTNTLFVVNRGGDVVETLGPVPGSEWFVTDGIRQILFFGAWLHMAAGRETFVVGAGKPYAFSVLSAEGGLRLADTGIPEVPLTDAAWEERLRLAMPRTPDQARVERLRAMPKPETMPAYAALLIDDEDRVWVQEFDAERSGRVVPYTVGMSPDRLGGVGDLQRWSVFDPSGALIGRLSLPSNVRITDIARGHLTTVVHDELGVERVQIFALQQK
jgi:hypothetical protein